MDGFERFAQGHLITLFSATNYCGTANNAGLPSCAGMLIFLSGNATPRDCLVLHQYCFPLEMIIEMLLARLSACRKCGCIQFFAMKCNHLLLTLAFNFAWVSEALSGTVVITVTPRILIACQPAGRKVISRKGAGSALGEFYSLIWSWKRLLLGEKSFKNFLREVSLLNQPAGSDCEKRLNSRFSGCRIYSDHYGILPPSETVENIEDFQ